MAGVGALWIARDRDFRGLGFIAAFGTWTLAPGIFDTTGWLPLGTSLPPQFPGIFVAVTVVLYCIWRLHFSKQTPEYFDRQVYIIANVCVFLFLILVSLWGRQSGWSLAFAGVLISMAIWLCKEFGSDMPNASSELDAARRHREQGRTQCPKSCIPDEGQLLDEIYLTTARWDSRTDSMFYLAGAWVAAGIILDSTSWVADSSPSQSDRDWLALLVVGSGLFFFVAFLLGCGKNWAFRQQAVDQTGATRGNMLATIDCSVELGGDKCGRVAEPRYKLYQFARGDAQGSCSLQHLVVFGAGRHNERLADALVTEAALASLPPAFCSKLRPERDWRRARKLSFARLLEYDPLNLTSRELPYNPVLELCIGRATDSSPRARQVFDVRTGCTTGAQPNDDWKDVETTAAAGLVVVTRCDPGALSEAAARLAHNKGQNTVWCFHETHGRCVATKNQILCALRSEFGGNPNIGIVFCK